MPTVPYIPEFITVHLGTPASSAQNVTVSFPDYIKNVASSEIYPTWPENAIRANIYAQISFALNRYLTEYYRSQGYAFDITNSTQYDQAFTPGRDYFQNISKIVDDIFNSFIVRQGDILPLFARYCNGTTVTCDGLSQWGTVPLANQGMLPYQILQYYYGDDINIETGVPVSPNVPSYPGYPLSIGDTGSAVRRIQVWLNRISSNYPSIPKIYPPDGIFEQSTENAVRQFQQIFNLTPDGIVGNATWYKIIFIYNAVKRLSELDSEGISQEEYQDQFPRPMRLGDTGADVRAFQFYLAVIGRFYNNVPAIVVNGVFDEATRDAVIAFQKLYGLTPDGIVGDNTWQAMFNAYRGIINSQDNIRGGVKLYPGTPLRLGSTGENVETIQQYLSTIAESFPEINSVPVTGNFGPQTQTAVRQFQELYGINPTGVVGPLTWYEIATLYSDLTVGNEKQPNQFPGFTIA